MKGKTYTFYIASTPGKLKKLIVSAYLLHGIAVLALIGGVTVIAAAGSYTRMLWKVGNYNALRHDQETLKKQYRQLQTTVNDTNQRLDSLQSLATEVAMTYGVLRYHPAAFDSSDNPVTAADAFDRSVEQYTFLKRNAAAIAVSSNGLRLMPAMSFADSTYTPAIWPVLGHITDSFGERLDPFSGEGAFHTGVDVSADYGAPVHATGDGIITIAENHAGYGRLVVIDHGFGITTWYAHLSSFSAIAGARVKRGEVVGYTGISGRSTGPHVHYEVRVNNAPVNPWRYMRSTPAGD
ncbi:MAG TPA: M23 family metallopeptidase [Candidatus Eisenbacteria bacterium]|jgi:murein DD-endopeptidase MepM/ murein hydrolase activator NlpD|nr:M23 family metallopeptidase [Candidatus Eisenbacteria bacterium]